jgi:hypothetical protein
MPYAYECEHFDERCPDEGDAKECVWCFTRHVTGQLFDTISEDEDAQRSATDALLTHDEFEHIKEGIRYDIIKDRVECCPHGIVQHMVFQYGYFDAIRQYKRGDGYIPPSALNILDDTFKDGDKENKFNRELLIAIVSFEMNESLFEYYEYQARDGRFKPTEYDKGDVSKYYCDVNNHEDILLRHDGHGGYYCEECDASDDE